MLPAQTWKEGKRTKQRICRNTYYFELKREYTGLSGQDLRQIKGRQPYLKCFCIHENTCFQIINLFTIRSHCVYIYTNLMILFVKSKHLLQVHASKFGILPYPDVANIPIMLETAFRCPCQSWSLSANMKSLVLFLQGCGTEATAFQF